MEAISIPNLAAAPQVPSPSAGAPSSGKSVDPSGLPSFAQVVQEILVRTTTQNDTQPAHTASSSSAATSRSQITPGIASSGIWSPRSPQLAKTVALSVVSLVNPGAMMLPVPPATPQAQTSTAIPSSSDPQSAFSSAADVAPSSPSVPTQTLFAPSLPNLSITGAANQFPPARVAPAPARSGTNDSVEPVQLPLAGLPDAATSPGDENSVAENPRPESGFLGIAANSLGEKSSVAPDQPSAPIFANVSPPSSEKNLVAVEQLPAPGLPDASALLEDKSPVAADQLSVPSLVDTQALLVGKNIVAADQAQSDKSSDQIGDPSAFSKPIADLQTTSIPPAFRNATAISFLQPQIVPWQPAAPATSSAAAAALPTPAHFAMSQASVKTVLSSAQLSATLPTAFGPQVLSVKNAPMAVADSPTVVLPANAPASNHSGSQNNSSSPGSQKASDSSATPGPGVSRDASVFSQALAAANDAKPPAALSAANQTTVIPAASTPVNDRPAAPSAASMSSGPANPPETPAHLLDAAPNPTVNDAQISQNSNHSEMRIAMQTDKLGAVELRAHVSGDEVGAAITVEKRDAHAALAVELPALQQALADKQLRVDQITLLHGPLHSTTGDAGAQSQSQPGDRGAYRAQIANTFLRGNSGAFVSFQSGGETRGIFDSQGRLSVQA